MGMPILAGTVLTPLLEAFLPVNALMDMGPIENGWAGRATTPR